MSQARRIHSWPLILLTLLLPLSPALGKEHTLFEPPGVPVKDYDKIVQELAPGDVLIFSDGSRCTLTRALGGGGVTSVWEIKETAGGLPLVRRIPLDRRSLKFVNPGHYPRYRTSSSKTIPS